MIVPIEAFVNPPEVVRDRMAFKQFYHDAAERYGTADFPEQLEMWHWYVAHIGWTAMQHTPATSIDNRTPVGVPNDVKPLCDLNTNRGFLVMLGTVALVLDLSGFDQAAKEFVAHAHHVAFDTGHLHMLAYDFVHTVSNIDVIEEERNRA
jgi:hypothetical protein